MSLPPAASVEGSLDTAEGKCVISHSLNVQEIINSVQDDSAGAIAVFIGMIRVVGYTSESSAQPFHRNNSQLLQRLLEYTYSKSASVDDNQPQAR